MTASPPYEVHIVSHTHWDREWYHPVGRFRQRLVELIDELLDDRPRQGESFLLDGQGVVLEDYLAVRPERASELSALLREGRLEAGPWYVLADELIPSGEALVRNLLAGRRVLRALRATSPPVLYCPDSFGHPAALPELAIGFGFNTIILWRGLGGRRWPSGDAFRWSAPSGAAALVYHLPSGGYDLGANLPVSESQAAERWRQLRELLAPRSRLGILLVHNGGDHHARQARRNEAVDALIAAARPEPARASSIGAFVRAFEARAAAANLPEIAGELRDSYGYSWTLQGTFGTRAAQKRQNALAERLLLREAEPWAALARLRGGRSRRALVDAAWKTLLQCHPHDTLCGCSLDEVAHAMDARLEEALVQGAGIRDDALADVVAHDPVAAREARECWHSVAIIRNAAPRTREGVAILRLKSFLVDEPVGHPSAGASISLPPPPEPALQGVAIQVLAQTIERDRVESPRHYPDNDFVATTVAAAWVPAVAAYGTLAVPQAERGTAPTPLRLVEVSDRSMTNGRLHVEVTDEGAVRVLSLPDGVPTRALIGIEDLRDAGDLYTPAPRPPAAEVRFDGFAVRHRGPLRGEIETRWTVRRPDEEPEDVAHLTVRLILDAGAAFLRLGVEGVSLAFDHRLRLVVRTALEDAVVYADATFGPVRRTPLEVPRDDARTEMPPPTAPLHRYVSLFSELGGATVFSDGLGECEVTRVGDVAITLVRGVGVLSRIDLPERPGHAGWPEETPWAQSPGPFEAAVAYMPHEGARTAATIDAIERAADDVLLPLTGSTLRSALDVPLPTAGFELDGEGLAFSAAKDSDDGGWLVLRCANLIDEPRTGTWHLGFPVREARRSRLDETPGDRLAVTDNGVSFAARPREIVTILVR
ncbi:MAG: glycosyl hydrolase-related protein [Gemmatimonadaceae bacterium]